MTACSLFSKERPTSGVSETPLPPNNAIQHKHGRRLQTNQKHIPHATGTIEKGSDSVTTPKLQANILLVT
jgi:hypothetical protein